MSLTVREVITALGHTDLERPTNIDSVDGVEFTSLAVPVELHSTKAKIQADIEDLESEYQGRVRDVTRLNATAERARAILRHIKQLRRTPPVRGI